jgi:MHS family proline/betaine transporter-like MFS transporter
MIGLSAVTFGIAVPPIIVALTEALPMAIRSGVVATANAFAIWIFGGSTQFVITELIRRTGDPLAPGEGAAAFQAAAPGVVEPSS